MKAQKHFETTKYSQGKGRLQMSAVAKLEKMGYKDVDATEAQKQLSSIDHPIKFLLLGLKLQGQDMVGTKVNHGLKLT